VTWSGSTRKFARSRPFDAAAPCLVQGSATADDLDEDGSSIASRRRALLIPGRDATLFETRFEDWARAQLGK